ncbi:MAG: serine/threonine-protein phosphatase [Oscillospiraceae bacterium]|nr:serine/threonine-protein phosphatase [Oscillospiraceae bacterium]
MHISLSYYTHIGRRPNNEDALAVAEGKGGALACVADGLGGHQNGEFASRAATDELRRLFEEESFGGSELKEAVMRADAAVRRVHETAPGALTTIAALWLGEYRAVAAHVGDSRIYQFRDGKVLYQSVDHSAAQLAVMAGEITPQQIRTHRDRNKLLRVLGGEREPKVSQQPLDVRPGDRFLICSDGFWEQITEETMLALARGGGDAASWLDDMRAAVQPRARDNNTAIAILVG